MDTFWFFIFSGEGLLERLVSSRKYLNFLLGSLFWAFFFNWFGFSKIIWFKGILRDYYFFDRSGARTIETLTCWLLISWEPETVILQPVSSRDPAKSTRSSHSTHKLKLNWFKFMVSEYRRLRAMALSFYPVIRMLVSLFSRSTLGT